MKILRLIVLLVLCTAPLGATRYFVLKDAANIVREKSTYTGDDSQADNLVAAFLSKHPGWAAQELTLTVFNATNVVHDPTQDRANAISELLTDQTSAATVLRAVFMVALDEINLLRQRDADRSVDVAASTSLADLKTRWAVRSQLDQRTATQFKTAVQNKINAGDAD